MSQSIQAYDVNIEARRSQVVELLEKHKLTHEQIATRLGISRKTVYRDLKARGLLPESQLIDKQSQALLDLLAAYKVHTVEQLKAIFDAPALTRANVGTYLAQLPFDQQAALFYNAGMLRSRVLREQQAQQGQAQQQEPA